MTSTRPLPTYRRVGEAEPDRKDGLEALDRLYTRTERWAELVDIVRARFRLADSRCSDHHLTFPAGSDSGSRAGRHAQSGRGPTRTSSTSIPSMPKRAPRWSGCWPAGHAARDRQVLEPLYRVGEEGRNWLAVLSRSSWASSPIRGATAVAAAAGGYFRSQADGQVAALRVVVEGGGEDPTSEQGLDELLAWPRATHQWENLRSAAWRSGVPGQ